MNESVPYEIGLISTDGPVTLFSIDELIPLFLVITMLEGEHC